MKIIHYCFILFFISSCGFKPMMAENAQGHKFIETIQLSDVSGPDQPKLERLISNHLGENLAKNPLYHLKINVSNEVSSVGVMKDSLSTRYKVKVIFNFTLTKIDTQKELDNGNIYLYSSYDVADSEFANFIAERYTNDNIIKELCEELKSRIILVLSSEALSENTSKGN